MSRPLRIEFPNAVYHIFSRGNERKEIFRSGTDYELFLSILKDTCERFDLVVHAYSLMPSHFHLLLETKDSNLSQAMKRLLGLYTVRFNRLHKRSGHLFQGRYKALLVDKDNYFLEVSRYVHLNPVKANIVQSPEDHPWSSMRYYLKEKAPDFLHRDFTLKSFQSRSDYKRFVMEGLKTGEDPFKKVIGGLIIGSEDFLNKLQAKIAKNKKNEFCGKKEFFRKPVDEVTKHLGDYDRNFSVYALWKYARTTQRQIGERFKISHSAVSIAVKRFQSRLSEDKMLRNRVMNFEKVIQKSNVED